MTKVSDIGFSQPLVSVKMLTYNHQPYIEKAINGVLSQEVDFGVHLVIGEDCSSDGTRELVYDFARRFPRHIEVVTSEKNVGMRANGARTGKVCRGKYVAFCEGDDFWHDSRKLAKQVNLLERDPSYVMVHSHCDRYYVRENRLERNSLTVPRNLDDGNAYIDLLLTRRRVMTLTVVAAREKVDWIRERSAECHSGKSTWPMGDTQLWLELSRVGKIGCIHESLATKHMLDESASSFRDPRRQLEFYLAARELKLRYLRKYPLEAHLDRTVRRHSALVLLHHACMAGDAVRARELYDEYTALQGEDAWRARVLLWGAHSPLRLRLARPVIKLSRKWSRLRRGG